MRNGHVTCLYMPLPSHMLIPANVQVNWCVTISALSNVFLASENHQSGALIWESSKHHGIGWFFFARLKKPMVWRFHGLQGTRHIHHPWHTLWLCRWPFCAKPFLYCDTWLDAPKTFSLIDAPQGDHPRLPCCHTMFVISICPNFPWVWASTSFSESP